MALVMSFILKRDTEVVDYEDAFGQMKTVDDFKAMDSYYGTLLSRCIFTQRRSVAKSIGCFQRRLTVCLSVCLSTR